jgi:hypothetical protein
MFADRPMKPRPGKPGIVRERLKELGRWLTEPMPPKNFSEDRYMGSAVEARNFTEQLMRLQDSLRAANSVSVPKVPARQP